VRLLGPPLAHPTRPLGSRSSSVCSGDHARKSGRFGFALERISDSSGYSRSDKVRSVRNPLGMRGWQVRRRNRRASSCVSPDHERREVHHVKVACAELAEVDEWFDAGLALPDPVSAKGMLECVRGMGRSRCVSARRPAMGVMSNPAGSPQREPDCVGRGDRPGGRLVNESPPGSPARATSSLDGTLATEASKPGDSASGSRLPIHQRRVSAVLDRASTAEQHERRGELRRQCRSGGFFGLLERERVNRRQYQTRAEARADVFDYIERFHNPRRARRTEQRTKEEAGSIQPSVEKG